MTGISLSDYLKELEYAAGPGAAKIASSVTASGNIQAKTGGVVHVPGTVLQSVLARDRQQSSRTSNAVSSGLLPKIADRMAADALNQGAALLSGNGKS